jgi:ABC-type microcin C transport system permease subunit YejB
MWAYVLKRILLLVPTIWLLCSLIFFFSKLVPGTFADRQKESIEEGVIAVGSSNSDARNINNQATQPRFYF